MRSTGLKLPRPLAILLVSFAGLLLEVAYTRIVSYKLLYYYTYLVIGLALLGIGSGAVLVAISGRLRRWSTQQVIARASAFGAVTITAAYFVVARLTLNTVLIWDYGSRHSFTSLARLMLICFALFVSFIAFGVIVAVLLGRAGRDVGRLYFSDLVGAGLGCLLAIPLIVRLGPPRVVMVAALVFAIVGVVSAPWRKPSFAISAIAAVVLIGVITPRTLLPDVYPEDTKQHAPQAVARGWGPVFRVDAIKPPHSDGSSLLLLHDATFGSRINRFDGDVSKLDYTQDPRSLPFAVLGTPPQHELIIGSAGGNEILASLAYHAPDIEAVELNPVTTSMLTKSLANYSGNLTKRPDVHLHQGDGRSYLARHDGHYDLLWYVAPDSYAATNAVSSGALVLSESYLYTKEMVKESLQHLSDDGIMVAQFGELSFGQPYRTARYVVTARAALEELGVKDAPNHLLVSFSTQSNLATIAVKRTAFTPAEVDRFLHGVSTLPQHKAYAAPGHALGNDLVTRLATGTNGQVSKIVNGYPKNITAVSDDAPYFWHFSRFTGVLHHIADPLSPTNPEDVIGERVLLLLLGIATFYAAVFLLAPFVFVRRRWRALPSKGFSAVYFAALGLGFMLYEITMIQRLVIFLGYPTYSLTVTLATILTSTGVGALLSRRFDDRPRTALPVLLAVLAVLTLFYELVLPHLLTGSLLSLGLAARVVATVIVLFPLGLCLGMFMPIGLRRVEGLSDDPQQYVAWGWAVNGFFSVIGSVLTTILSMSLGFRTVQVMGLTMYAIAVLAFTQIRARNRIVSLDEDEPALVPAEL